MAVGSSFDHWQKDVFFKAAEEVQESADKMESLYRMWIRSRRDELEFDYSEGLLRELQTALGTAKWQLEEFARAVGVCHSRYLSEESTTVTRRRDFVAAIENQILRIEMEINALLFEEGKQPLRWVQLDEEERDDLAAFLSGVPRNGLHRKDKATDFKGLSRAISGRDCVRGYGDGIVTDERSVVKGNEMDEKGRYKMKEKVVCMEVAQQNGRIPNSLENPGSWRIDIPNEEDLEEKITGRSKMLGHESCSQTVPVPAEHLNHFKNSSSKVKNGEQLQPRHHLSKFLHFNRVLQFVKGKFTNSSRYRLNRFKEDSLPTRNRQPVGRHGGFQNRLQGSQHCTKFARSMRLTLLLVLTIVFVAPFILYAA